MLLKPGTNTGGYATMSYTVTLDKKATEVVLPTKLHHSKFSVPSNYSCRVYWNDSNPYAETSTPVYLGTGSTQEWLTAHTYSDSGTYTIRVVSYRPNFPVGYSNRDHPLIVASNQHYKNAAANDAAGDPTQAAKERAEALRLISFANYTTGVLKDGDNTNVSRCKDLSGVLAWFKLSDKFCGRKLNTSSCKYANYIAVAPDSDTYGDDKTHYPDGAVTSTENLFTQFNGIEEAIHAFRGRHWLVRALGDFNSLIWGDCMFYECYRLETINDGAVAGSKFTALYSALKMFYYCISLKSSVFCNMTGASITDATQMFCGCYGADFKYLHNVSNPGAWSLPNVVNFEGFLQNCTNVNTLPPSLLENANPLYNFRDSLSDIQLHNIDGTTNYFGSNYYNVGSSARDIFSRIWPYLYAAVKRAGASRISANGTNVDDRAYFWIGVPSVSNVSMSPTWTWRNASISWASETGNTYALGTHEYRASQCYYIRHTIYNITIAAGLLGPGNSLNISDGVYSATWAARKSALASMSFYDMLKYAGTTWDSKGNAYTNPGFVITANSNPLNRIGGNEYYINTSSNNTTTNNIGMLKLYNTYFSETDCLFTSTTGNGSVYGKFTNGTFDSSSYTPSFGENNQSTFKVDTGTYKHTYNGYTYSFRGQIAAESVKRYSTDTVTLASYVNYQYYIHSFSKWWNLNGTYIFRFYGLVYVYGAILRSAVNPTLRTCYLYVKASDDDARLAQNEDPLYAPLGPYSTTAYGNFS